MNTTAERIKEALERSRMTQAELCRITGIGKSSMSTYLTGEYEPKQKNLYKMAKALGVTPEWLMGLDVPEIKLMKPQTFDNIFPISVKKLPLLGEIACGEPIFANTDRESYVLSGTDIDADFCLKAKGDSMIGARIHDGDVVFIHKTDEVRDGDIAAVIIDDEVLLKRFYWDREAGLVTLQSENPAYRPKILKGEELNHVHVLGKAIAFQSDII